MLANMQGKRNSYSLLVEMFPASMEMVGQFLKKLKMELPYDPVIPLLGIYAKEPKLAY
jgi:hypothetical protein